MARVAVFAAAGLSASGPERSEPVGPEMAPDTGAGELLVGVEGGVYGTREEAEAANRQMSFGDVAGYYVVPVAQFQGFREGIGASGDFAQVSVFRTQEAALQFAEMARAFGYPATILPERVRSLGGLYAGLGQEANQNGSGPLTRPIPESLP